MEHHNAFTWYDTPRKPVSLKKPDYVAGRNRRIAYIRMALQTLGVMAFAWGAAWIWVTN